MEPKRSWWQKSKRPLSVIGIISASMLVIALIVGIIGGYLFNWNRTGLGPYTSPPHTSNSDFQRGKTLWDWMQLLFIPVVLAVAGFWFNHRERKAAELRAENEREEADLRTQAERDIEQQRAEADREISYDNQREVALKEYIDKISELLLHENLRKSQPDNEVRKIARVLTLTVLPRLDGGRKRSVLQFLYESGLLDKDKCIVDVTEADLNRAYLSNINLSRAEMSKTNLDGVALAKANLSGANLTGSYLLSANLNIANLRGTNLTETNFTGADLSGANFTGANLHKTVLRYANVSGAIFTGTGVTDEQLKKAKGYQNVIMPDGPILP